MSVTAMLRRADDGMKAEDRPVLIRQIAANAVATIRETYGRGRNTAQDTWVEMLVEKALQRIGETESAAGTNLNSEASAASPAIGDALKAMDQEAA